ncbi:hypothetical protein OA167_02955 [Pelagibacteraceae bacterium]|nr:hypothetical protein [Pelagibacteraceae bacterium]
MIKFFYILAFFIFTSCSGIDLVYKNNVNLVNPLYEKTKVTTSGKDLSFINSYLPMYFGSNQDNDYKLSINIEEEKTNRSVESNQATSNIRYELRFVYSLISNKKNCVVSEKEILSYFSIIPKSAGYNYGTDASLEKKYEIAIVENLDSYINYLSNIDINLCK